MEDASVVDRSTPIDNPNPSGAGKLNELPLHIPIYAINLDRSIDRWTRLNNRARDLGLSIIRVPAVDGSTISAAERRWSDDALFQRLNGRPLLPGEYGCYRSHFKALQLFLDSGAKAAVIVEDDIELIVDIEAQATAIIEAMPSAELVKLVSHRSRGFIRKGSSRLGHDIGRCLHGPQGSAAGYLVTRDGAEKLMVAISTMTLPYDVAIERGWATGIQTYTVKHDVLELGPLRDDTEIASQCQYRDAKISGRRRLRTHIFRATDYLRRIAYALKV
ncbi:MAG: glycosyltransferase family 25 protein [Allorhizobium sp.]